MVENVKDRVNLSKNKSAGASAPKVAGPSLQASQSASSSSDQIRQILLRKQKEKRLRMKAKSRMPKMPILICVVLLVGAIVLHNEDKAVLAFLERIQIGVFSNSEAAESQEKPAAAPAKKAEAAVESTKEVPAEKTAWTEEEMNLFRGLDERKKQLDEREKELNALSDELQKQKTDLEKKLAQLEQTREQISSTLGETVQKDEEKLGKLVEMYAGMKPASAAKVFETIDENLAVDILGRMKKNNAASILNLMDPQKARRISEKYAGYMRK